MIIKLKNILPNPNRDFKTNPLDPAKTAELVASINTTGFWDNVVVRKNADGKYECAYGHHRLAAALQAGLVEADFIVKEFDDELMIKVMDNENREAYGTSPLSLIESVRAVVKGLAEGRVRPFVLDGRERKDSIRYAPSFVAGGDVEGSSLQMAYTAMNIAVFLGRTEAKGNRIRPEDSIIAALNALFLMEKGKLENCELFKEKLVRPVAGAKATEVRVPLSTNELLTLTTERKRDVLDVEIRRGKSQAELNELREKQLAAQKKAKEAEKATEVAHKAYVQKLADAKRDENNRKADADAKAAKEADSRAKEKEALNKLRMAELDAQIKAKKEWEAEQHLQDLYLPVRRDVESMLGKLETMASERNPMRELVKSLAREKKLTPVDRERLRKAAITVSDWFGGWVATQFTANFSPKKELEEMRVREKAKRKCEK